MMIGLCMIHINKKNMRIVFVNLHGNEFLVKTLNKIIFKQSVAIKHKYFLDYLLSREDVEVCSFINRRGLSLSYSTQNPLLQSFRFIEHKITMRKNGIDCKKIKVLKNENDIQPNDILILYQFYKPQFEFVKRPQVMIANSMIHFGTSQAQIMKELDVNVMFNESILSNYSKIFDKYYNWFKGDFILQPFVFAPRFKPIKSFNERKNKAVSVGTVTYMQNITEVYGDPCAQPARKQIKDNASVLEPWVDCFNSDYLEDDKKVNSSNPVTKIFGRLYAKFFTGHQKAYYSFDMVEKFNDYKMCVVGEEIMGIPGVGFVEGMASGCAYIGQTVGYYEDYGMIEGVHYIGYDGSLEDLKKKISYYQRPEHQEELEKIAKTGCEFVRSNFNGPASAEKLLNNLIEAQNRWKKNNG